MIGNYHLSWKESIVTPQCCLPDLWVMSQSRPITTGTCNMLWICTLQMTSCRLCILFVMLSLIQIITTLRWGRPGHCSLSQGQGAPFPSPVTLIVAGWSFLFWFAFLACSRIFGLVRTFQEWFKTGFLHDLHDCVNVNAWSLHSGRFLKLEWLVRIGDVWGVWEAQHKGT